MISRNFFDITEQEEGKCVEQRLPVDLSNVSKYSGGEGAADICTVNAENCTSDTKKGSGSASEVLDEPSTQQDTDEGAPVIITLPESYEEEGSPGVECGDDEEWFEVTGRNFDGSERVERRKCQQPDPESFVGPVFRHQDVARVKGEWQDITPRHPLAAHGVVSRGVLKRVLRPGTGACPRAGSVVKVRHHLLGFFQNNNRIFLDTRHHWLPGAHKGPEEWIFGCDQQMASLEAAMFTMRAGEKCRLKIKWQYAFGERGIQPGPPRVPPRSDIYLDVEVFGWTPADKQRGQMSAPEMLQEAMEVKEEAVKMFKRGQYAEANYILDDVFTCIKLMYHEYIQVKYEEVRELEAAALRNQALCYLKMGDYEMAERRVRKALEICQQDTKCLLWLGIACNEQRKYAEAKIYLRYAIAARPELRTLRVHYNVACVNLKEERLASERNWTGVFSRTNRLGDQEERDKMAENKAINERLEGYARRRETEPPGAAKENKVMTPSQIVQRYRGLAESVSESMLGDFRDPRVDRSDTGDQLRRFKEEAAASGAARQQATAARRAKAQQLQRMREQTEAIK